jgi:hypothetical protein
MEMESWGRTKGSMVMDFVRILKWLRKTTRDIGTIQSGAE